METRKHCTNGICFLIFLKLGSAVLWLLAFPEGNTWKHENTAHTEDLFFVFKLGSAALWLLAFPEGKQHGLPVHCIGTRKLSNIILI